LQLARRYCTTTTLGDTSAAVVRTRHVSTLLRSKQVLAIALGDLPTVFHFSELNETKSMSLPVVRKILSFSRLPLKN